MKHKRYKMVPIDEAQWSCHNCDICAVNICPNPGVTCYIPWTYWWFIRIHKPRYFNIKIDRQVPDNIKVL